MGVATITNRIYVTHHHNNKSSSVIHSNNKFFIPKSLYVIRFDGKKLVLKQAPIDHKGKSYTASPTKGHWITLSFAVIVPLGYYTIAEDETNEDQLVVYMEDKIKF